MQDFVKILLYIQLNNKCQKKSCMLNTSFGSYCFLCSSCTIYGTFFTIVKDPSIVKTYVTCRKKGVKQTIPVISILCLYDAWRSFTISKNVPELMNDKVIALKQREHLFLHPSIYIRFSNIVNDPSIVQT